MLNLKAGFPTAKQARDRLANELTAARSRGVAVLKLVHGYGSSGRGGRLRTSLRTWLRDAEPGSGIGAIVAGEDWSVFDADARALLDRHPALRHDVDLERGNPGITFVEVRR